MARRTSGVSGLDEVLKNLNTKVKAVEGGSQRGLHRAALLIKRKAMQKTPVVTGHLRGSAFVTMGVMKAIIGFSAAYAVFVHENPNAGTSDLPGASEVGMPKFLELAVKENQREIVEIIAKDARIK